MVNALGLGVGLQFPPRYAAGAAPSGDDAPPSSPAVTWDFWLDGANFTPSTWTDTSGNSNHATQATASAQPTATTLGGITAASFDGADGMNVSFGVADGTLIIVTNVATDRTGTPNAARFCFMGNTGAVAYTPERAENGSATGYVSPDLCIGGTSFTTPATRNDAYAAIVLGTSQVYVLRGAMSGSINQIGRSQFSYNFKGVIGLIAKTATTLTNAQVNTVASRAATRFGLSWVNL